MINTLARIKKQLTLAIQVMRIRRSTTGRVDAKWNEVSTHWGERAAELMTTAKPTSWTDSPLVQSMYIHPLISGRPDVGWLETIAKRYFPSPVDLALSLGCGGGGLERHGVSLNIARHFVAYDVSDSAIALARVEANKFGTKRITYKAADLNTLVQPENTYDVVFASQSLHHIASLEYYLDQVRRALKPQGLFIINEFVGPNQFQWTDAQMCHAQRLLDTIPMQYRETIQGHGLKNEITRPTIELMNQIDPTEAIRSTEIIAEVNKRFEVVEKVDFGGTLLQLVLGDIVGNFTDNQEDCAILQSLFNEEQRLLKSGDLESDFTLMVMRNSK